MMRSPIISVLGHVDHGKTTLLDKIRGSNIAAKEPGAITQHVGASFIPVEEIKKRCSAILKKYSFELKINGLLFIDTPGHAAFMNMRKRGGSIADLAVLVIDIQQGIQEQTKESIKILKSFKTPFVIAANKIDLIEGWVSQENTCFLESLKVQREDVKARLDEKIYKIVADLGEENLNSERFDRVSDFTKQIIIIPVSAKTGEGIQEMLLFLAGLAQKFMGEKLHIDLEKKGYGTVLEVKEFSGLGVTMDVILYEGNISVGDYVAVQTLSGPATAKVKALLLPAPMEEIRDPRKKFKNVEKVYAAAGVKISAPGLENIIVGSTLAVGESEEEALEKIKGNIVETEIHVEKEGVCVKADALGSLEAIVKFFSENKIPIKKASIGAINKSDVLETEAERQKNRYHGIIFGFNVAVSEDAMQEANKNKIPIVVSNVIYDFIEKYAAFVKEEQEKEKIELLTKFNYPFKAKVLPGCIFRSSKPAIIGVEILAGVIKPEAKVINEKGNSLGKILSIQESGKSLDKAEKGQKVAIAVSDAVCGRNIFEGSIIYAEIPLKETYILIEKNIEKDIVKEIQKIIEGSEKR
ncbi:MAG: translation initiation factor IF-2 [archaeon]